MTYSNRLTPGLILISLFISTIICVLYYFLRPTPVSISEITSSAPTSVSDTATLRGIVSRDSPPNEPGDYYLLTSDYRMIKLVSDTDLVEYLGYEVSIKGDLTLYASGDPSTLTIDLINVSN